MLEQPASNFQPCNGVLTGGGGDGGGGCDSGDGGAKRLAPLLTLHLDLWPLIRDLAGADVASVLSVVCTSLRALVGDLVFWNHFQQPYFNVNDPKCRRILTWLPKPATLLYLSIERKVNTRDFSVLSGFAVDQLHISDHTNYFWCQLLPAFASIVELHVQRCSGFGCELLSNPASQVLFNPYQHALQTLVFRNCADITDVDFAGMRHFTSLRALEIDRCNHLSSACLAELQHCRSLETLEISLCPRISTMHQLQRCQSLCKLYLYHCANVKREDLQGLKASKPSLAIFSQFGDM